MQRCIVESPVAVAIGGVPFVLSRSMPDVPDDDPVVQAAPWAFEPVDAPVERATSRPGEKRATRRRKTADADEAKPED